LPIFAGRFAAIDGLDHENESTRDVKQYARNGFRKSDETLRAPPYQSGLSIPSLNAEGRWGNHVGPSHDRHIVLRTSQARN
jgi:hypothetical protein